MWSIYDFLLLLESDFTQEKRSQKQAGVIKPTQQRGWDGYTWSRRQSEEKGPEGSEQSRAEQRHTHHVHFLLQLVHILLFLLPLPLLLAALLRGRSQLILLTSFLETHVKTGEKKMRNQDSNSKKQIISKLTIITVLTYRCRKTTGTLKPSRNSDF